MYTNTNTKYKSPISLSLSLPINSLHDVVKRYTLRRTREKESCIDSRTERAKERERERERSNEELLIIIHVM